MRVYTSPIGKEVIDNDVISNTSTYSSQKIGEILGDIPLKITTGEEGDILIRTSDGGYKTSGIKLSELAIAGHGHPASSMEISTVNLGGALSSEIDTVQKLADFIDDNMLSQSYIDSQISNIEHKRTTFTAVAGQTNFDMGEPVSRIDNVTRNGVDLDPEIFTINSPYIQYRPGLNGTYNIRSGDIIIFNFI